jgi:hypothetical protein
MTRRWHMSEHASPPRVLGDLASEVRCKNAGPFWVTLEAFLPDEAAYRIAEELVTAETVGRLYRVPPGDIQLFRLPHLRVIKASFPRPVSQGSLHDRDIHAGQHHVPLATLLLPAASAHPPPSAGA